MKSIIWRSLLTAGCAILLASGFLWPWLWPCSLFGLLMLLFLLGRSEMLSQRQLIWQCAVFGYVFFGIVLNWMYGIKTTELIGDTFFASLFLGLTYALMVGALAIGFIVAGYLYKRLGISTKDRTILFIPALWVIGEAFRSIFFSIFSLGDGGSIGLYWNFGALGLLFVETPLGFAARIVGLQGLSFLVVLLVVSFYQILHRKFVYGLLILIPIVCSLLGWGLYRTPSGGEMKVGTVSVQADVQEEYIESLKQKLPEQGPLDALVMPEYSYYFADSSGVPTKNTMPVDIQLIIDSSSAPKNGRIENMVGFHLPDGTVLQQYQKNFLIPGGEYIPYLYHMILFYSGNTNLVREFHVSKAVAQAAEKEQPYRYQNISYGALACSGAIAPELYRHLGRQGAEIFTNSASISTLGVADSYYGQAQHMAMFIALANAKPFVQSARGGPSYVIDTNGKVIAEKTTAGQADVTTATITINTPLTIYTRFGEWVIYGALLMVGCLLFMKRFVN